jgi:hypothetical protein
MGFNIQNITQFYNMHKGQKCFMIGAGPSLTPEILDAIKDEESFAMNNISMIYPETEWRPTYYINVARTTNRDEHWARCATESVELARHNFMWSSNIWLVKDRLKKECNVSLLSCAAFPQWSWVPFDWVSRWGSSMFAALQIAVFLGFNPIYLLGCDLNYENSLDPETMEDTAHFSSDYLGNKKKENIISDLGTTMKIDELRTYVSHQIAQMNTLARGIWIKTCLDGKLSSVYPYTPLEAALVSSN